MEDLKNVWTTWHISWVLLASAFFHRKSANFALSINTHIANVDVINHAISDLHDKNSKCKKTLINELFDECTENVDEVKLNKETLAGSKNSYKRKSCILYIVLFHFFLQIMLEFLLILFAMKTWILIKKMFLNMNTSTKQQLN